MVQFDWTIPLTISGYLDRLTHQLAPKSIRKLNSLSALSLLIASFVNIVVHISLNLMCFYNVYLNKCLNCFCLFFDFMGFYFNNGINRQNEKEHTMYFPLHLVPLDNHFEGIKRHPSL
jgi:hypothetical protein